MIDRTKSPEPGYMTYHEAAAALGLRPNTLRARHAAYGLFPALFPLVGGSRVALFRASDVDRVRVEREGG